MWHKLHQIVIPQPKILARRIMPQMVQIASRDGHKYALFTSFSMNWSKITELLPYKAIVWWFYQHDNAYNGVLTILG